jgi:hypothetical protein
MRSEYNPNGIPERTIMRSDVMELGPVAFGANPTATATVRSQTDEFYSRLRQRDQSAFEDACRAANIKIPDFSAANPQREVGGSEHDSEPGRAAQSSQERVLGPRRRALHQQLLLKGIL